MRVIDTAAQELMVERPNLALEPENIATFIGRTAGGQMPACPAGGVYGDFDRLVTCSFQDIRFEHALPQ